MPDWKPQRLLLLSNQHARRARRQHSGYAGQLGCSPGHELLVSSQQETRAWLRQLQPAAADLLAINGGDGTVSEVLSSLAEIMPVAQWPVLMFLPGGTTNMTAHAVGSPLGRRISLPTGPIADQQIREMQAMQIRDGDLRRVGFCFGIGAVVNGVRFYRDEVARLAGGGEWMSGWVLMRVAYGIARGDRRFLSAAPVHLNACGVAEARTLLVLVSTTLERMFLGINPFWGNQHEAIRATWIDAVNSGFFSNLHRLVRGGRGLTERDGYFSRNLASLSVATDLPWFLDGELVPHQGPVREIGVSSFGHLKVVRLN